MSLVTPHSSNVWTIPLSLIFRYFVGFKRVAYDRQKVSDTLKNCAYRQLNWYCAADFSLLNLPKGKILGRSKPATNS